MLQSGKRTIAGEWVEYVELYKEYILNEPLTEFMIILQKILTDIPTEEHKNVFIETEGSDYSEICGSVGGGLVIYQLKR